MFSLVLVDSLHESTDVVTKHAREGKGFGSNDGHVEAARPQRSGRFEADEASADDDGGPSGAARGDDGAAVRERPQDMNVGKLRAVDGQTYRLRPGGEDEDSVFQ